MGKAYDKKIVKVDGKSYEIEVLYSKRYGTAYLTGTWIDEDIYVTVANDCHYVLNIYRKDNKDKTKAHLFIMVFGARLKGPYKQIYDILLNVLKEESAKKKKGL